MIDDTGELPDDLSIEVIAISIYIYEGANWEIALSMKIAV